MMLILVVQLGFDLLVVFQIPTKLLLEGRLNAVLLEWLSGELFVGLKLEEEVFWSREAAALGSSYGELDTCARQYLIKLSSHHTGYFLSKNEWNLDFSYSSSAYSFARGYIEQIL